MTADELREAGERFSRELAREGYLAGAGLKDATDFAGIFARHAALASEDAWHAARHSPPLREWVADTRVGRAVAPLDDRLHAWEAAATVALPDGERLPYQSAGIAIANEADRGRRLAIDRARRAILAEPAAMRTERLGVERDLLLALTGLGVVEARAWLSGIDLDALAEGCDGFLARTADRYADQLKEHLRRVLDLAPGDAHRVDASVLFRGASFDRYFPGASLVETARAQVGEMGFDAAAGGRVRFDTEDRERKRARAFCAPVAVPDEVWLVIRPHGGYVDYRSFWHELGHALHFGTMARGLPFEHRWLGDNSVTEAWAMLFEHMLVARPWLRRYAGLNGGALDGFLREQAFNTLAMLRRYAAKLRYEIDLHRAPTLAQGAAGYVERLSAATGFRYEAEDALLDLDDGFYAARYLRAWQLEAALRAALVERFDEDWFRNPRTGPWLLDLLARGQQDDAAALAPTATGRPLGFEALTALCEAAPA